MKGKKFILIVMAASILNCCHNPSGIIKNNQLVVFDIQNFGISKQVNLSDIGVSEIQYIPLETNPNSSISDVNNPVLKLKLIDGDYYISEMQSIIRFGADGHFISQINRGGRGPEEYLMCHDFDIGYINKYLYVLSAFQDKIFVYTKTGEFIRIIKAPQKSTSFSCFDKGILCYSRNQDGTVENSFDIIDYNGNKLKTFPNKYSFKKNFGKHQFAYTVESPIYRFNNHLFVKELYTDTVYSLKNLKFTPSFILNAGDKRFHAEALEQINSNESFKEIGKKYIIDNRTFQFGDFIYYEFRYRGTRYSLFAKNDGSVQYLSNIDEGYINDIDGGPNFNFITAKDDNTALGWINTYELKNYITSEKFKNSTPKYPEKKKALEELSNSLDENNNPVLMLVKLKE